MVRPLLHKRKDYDGASGVHGFEKHISVSAYFISFRLSTPENEKGDEFSVRGARDNGCALNVITYYPLHIF